MGRSLDVVIVTLPRYKQVEIEMHHDVLKDVDGLRELRQIMGKAQAEIASTLNITQPSVSKIEKQADMRLSTLRNYVEAVGGELELTVKLPKRPTLRIHHLGELAPDGAVPAEKKSSDSSPRRRHG